MRWFGLVLLLSSIGCRFDTSTDNSGREQIDASPGDYPGQVDAMTTGTDASVPLVDASTPTLDANLVSECEQSCDTSVATCSQAGVCTYTCTGLAPCGDIVCPANVPCDVSCTSNSGSACGNVTCAFGQPCNVNCNGNEENENAACESVDCNNSCKCDVTCNTEEACGPTTCNSTIIFPFYCGETGEDANDCTSSQLGCTGFCL